MSDEIKERTYDVKCREQGRMIQVSIPASVPLREFEYNAEIEIIKPLRTPFQMLLIKVQTLTGSSRQTILS